MTTLKDIAQVTGFSITTVSRVLNDTAGKVGISEQTQQKIRQVAKELNYRPNKTAQNLKLGRQPRAILFLHCELNKAGEGEGFMTHPFFSHLLHGIHLGASRTGHYLAYLDAGQTRTQQLRAILEEAVSGVISFGKLTPLALRVLQRKNVPTVAIEPYVAELERYSVYVDNEMAVRQALEHLLHLGHRHICFLTLDNEVSGSFVERTAAFRGIVSRLDGMLEGEVETAPKPRGISDISASFKAAKKLMEREKSRRPTAIITPNDLCALGVLRAARASNLNVPRDLSVVGIDDIDWSAYSEPPLTTVRIPKEEMGRRAVNMLNQLLEGKAVRPEKVRVGTQLIIRESTGPVSVG